MGELGQAATTAAFTWAVYGMAYALARFVWFFNGGRQ